MPKVTRAEFGALRRRKAAVDVRPSVVIKGTITAGKLADFVVLEKDPHHVDPSEIKDIKIARTVVGGRTMHPKSELQ